MGFFFLLIHASLLLKSNFVKDQHRKGDIPQIAVHRLRVVFVVERLGGVMCNWLASSEHMIAATGHVFCLCLNKALANERWPYLCNVFSHWLRHCYGINRKKDQVMIPSTNRVYRWKKKIMFLFSIFYLPLIPTVYETYHIKTEKVKTLSCFDLHHYKIFIDKCNLTNCCGRDFSLDMPFVMVS